MKKKLTGSSILKIFFLIKQFIKQHPKEFICLNLSEIFHNKLASFQNNLLRESILSIFSQYMITQNDVEDWFHVEKITMQKIWQHGKNILICFSNSNITNQGYVVWNNLLPLSQKALKYQIPVQPGETVGLFVKKQFFHDQKIPKTEVKELFKMNNTFVESYRKDLSKFLISRMNLSKEFDKKNFMKTLVKSFRNKMLSIKRLTQLLKRNDDLIQYIISHIKKFYVNICNHHISQSSLKRTFYYYNLTKSCQIIPISYTHSPEFYSELHKSISNQTDSL